jgi:1,4-dihydroxy-2-naphthoate octaprenyltransferase
MDITKEVFYPDSISCFMLLNVMTTLSSWFLVTRPKTLLVALAVILLGQTLAWFDSPAHFSVYIATLCMICCMALQIAVNLSNDYFDGKNGVDGDDRLGPDRALQKGLISASNLRLGIIVMCLLAIVSGCYLIYVGGWAYVVLGLLSLLGVYVYSGGPRPLASHGLGEVAVFLYFGWLAVVGSYYLQTQVLTIDVFIPASQVGFLVVAIMLVNNIRDVASDRRAQKFTLATRLGVKASKHLYCITMLLPSLLLLVDRYQGLTMLLVLPVQLALCIAIYQRDGKQLNTQLAQTSMAVLLWGVFYSVDLMFR